MVESLTPVGRLLQTAVEKNIPINALLELTYRCNLHCGHCYVSPSVEPELTTDEVYRVLDQLAESGCLFLTLSGGEVMLRPDLFDIIRYARARNFSIRLFSNGTLLDRAAAEEFAASHVTDVGVSLYGATASTHEAVTGAEGSFDGSIRALELLRDAGVKTVAKYLIMSHNVSEYKAARALSESLDAAFSFSYMIGPKTDGDPTPFSWRLDDDMLRRVLSDDFLYEGAGRVPLSDRTDQRGPALETAPMCGAGRDNCVISPYGEIKPCTMLPLVAGNVRQQTFADIWQSASTLLTLRDTYMKDLPVCRDCRSIGYCGRCPGFALLEDGDILGPSSFACGVEKITDAVGVREGCLLQVGTETLFDSKEEVLNNRKV